MKTANITGFRRFALALAAILCLFTEHATGEALRVGKSTLTSFSYTLLEVGVESGIFRKHGLEVEASAFGGGPRLIQAMTAGAIDIGLDGGTDMAMIAKGAPIKTIAPLSGAPLEIVIAVRHDGPIKTIEDLKGKKIAITGLGTLTGWLTRELVRSLGWSDRDVTYVTVSNVAASRALLKAGEIDAVTTDMTTTLQNALKGEERVLFSLGDVVKDFHMQVIFATDQLIKAKPETVRAFMAAWLDTIAFAKTNKDATVGIIQRVLGFDPQVLSNSYDRLIGNYSTDGKFNQLALAVLAKSYVDLKLLDKEPDMKSLYTDAFLPNR